jgi:hypothetical protein
MSVITLSAALCIGWWVHLSYGETSQFFTQYKVAFFIIDIKWGFYFKKSVYFFYINKIDNV